jgi:hypothetical protein
MKYLYAIAVVVVLSLGLAASFYLGQQPQSIVRVTYHPFNEPKELSTALLTLLREPLKSGPVLLLGVTPGVRADLEFWKSFLDENSQGEGAYKVVVVDPKLPVATEMFTNAVQLYLKNEIERFVHGATNAEAQGLRMVVIAPTIYTSQTIVENSVQILASKYGMKPLSLSIVKFPRSVEDEEKMETPCKLGDQNREGTGALGCAILKRAKPLYRTKAAAGTRFEGLVDQVDTRDYLIFWNEVKP